MASNKKQSKFSDIITGANSFMVDCIIFYRLLQGLLIKINILRIDLLL
jgi:hypothetical protein